MAAWRLASPHWTPKRERMIGGRLEAARVGETDEGSEEPDPIESFRSQWLNQWPPKRTIAAGEDGRPVASRVVGRPARAGHRSRRGRCGWRSRTTTGQGAAVAVVGEDRRWPLRGRRLALRGLGRGDRQTCSGWRWCGRSGSSRSARRCWRGCRAAFDAGAAAGGGHADPDRARAVPGSRRRRPAGA